MARIDSILNLVDRQGANELRLGSDREPQMFADGAQKRLTMPKTPTDTLRELLGELLPPERERMVAAQGQVQFLYEPAGLGPFRVTVTRRGPAGAPIELDVIFVRGRGKGAPAAAPPVAPPPAPRVVEAPPRAVEAMPVATSVAAAAGASPHDGATPEIGVLLARAAAMGASDVHLVDGEAPVVRIDGRLRPIGGEPVSIARLLGARLAAEAERRNSAGFSADLGLAVDGVGRVRVNVFQTAAGLAAAVRILKSTPPALAQLGLPVPLDDLVMLPHGLVIVCGPTGSGKSTTLAALAHDALERRASMVITLEDPIEYVLGQNYSESAARTSSGRPGAKGVVRQRQVGRDVKDFAAGLRDALREDPDILLIGEMRDPETISLALTAAETGHLVLASLHSRSAASAVERIVDTYAPERQQQIRVQLADALRVVVAQRLLPRASGEGRVIAVEVLRGTHAVQNAVREAKTSAIQSAIQAGKKDGMLPLDRCLADLVQRRQITLEDARAVANDPASLASYLSG